MAIANYTSVTIETGETIEGLAERYLGDATRWPEIVSLNRLRYPFVSDDPVEQVGPALETTKIRAYQHSLGSSSAITKTTIGVFAGEIFLAVTDDVTVRPGQVAFLVTYNTTLGPQWETIPILGVGHSDESGNTVWDSSVINTYGSTLLSELPPSPVIVLQSGTVFPWSAGTSVTIHENPTETIDVVLGPGSVIKIPSAAPSINISPTLGDLLGTDVALDNEGHITYDSDGRLVLTTGIANLNQALKNRLLTPVGELPLHQDYGDKLLDLIGESYPETLVRANSAIRQCVVQDDRVNSVSESRATLTGDILTVDVTVELQQVKTLVEVTASLPFITG